MERNLRYYRDIPLGEEVPGAGSGLWDFVAPAEVAPAEAVPAAWEEETKQDDVPEKIRQLRKMCLQNPWSLTRNKAFYAQALFMADYEDDAPIVPFMSYFPVYRDMSLPQLRSYFTVRRLLRKGIHPEASLSYLFVYIYEILMQVGTGSPEEGLELLEDLRDGYRGAEPKLMHYLTVWIRDYIVYYGLTGRTEEYFRTEREEDALTAALADCRNEPDGTVFEAAASLSKYKIKEAALYRKCPGEVSAVAARVIRAAIPLLETRHHHHFDTLCFGLRRKLSYPMFSSAVFYSPHLLMEAAFEISPQRKFVCKKGLWTVDTYTRTGKEGWLEKLLHETDRRLRLTLHAGQKIHQRLHDPEMEYLIQQTIDGYLKEKAEEARPKVRIDFSRLIRIREDAEAVKEALLTEEEKEEAAALPQKTEEAEPALQGKEEAAEALHAAETPQKAEEPHCCEAFSAEERSFLHLLMEGGDWNAYLRQIRMPAGVMTDQINGKMMEEIGDIVLEDDGKGLALIEDYREEIICRIQRNGK